MDAEKLAQAFVDLADTLVDDFDVLDLLHVLASRCVDLLGVTAAGLLLVDEHDRLRVAMSSSEGARLLELFQLQTDEGPCLECFRTGRPVAVDRLDCAADRWPRFAPAAVGEGFGSVLALPMRLRGEVIGGLNLFGDVRTAGFAPEIVPIAQSMADVATIAILQDRLLHQRDVVADQLQTALNSRVAIEQAKGVLATRLDIGTDEAFDLIRRRARDSRRHLIDVAEEIVRTRPDGHWTGFHDHAG